MRSELRYLLVTSLLLFILPPPYKDLPSLPANFANYGSGPSNWLAPEPLESFVGSILITFPGAEGGRAVSYPNLWGREFEGSAWQVWTLKSLSNLFASSEQKTIIYKVITFPLTVVNYIRSLNQNCFCDCYLLTLRLFFKSNPSRSWLRHPPYSHNMEKSGPS